MGRVLVGEKVVGTKDTSGKFTSKKGIILTKSERDIIAKETGETQIQTTRDAQGRVTQTVEATPKAKKVLTAVDPTEAEQVQVRKDKPSKDAGPVQAKAAAAKAKGSVRIQATPAAARVLKDIKHEDAEKVIVPTGRTLPGGTERFWTELSPTDYNTYADTKALGKEEKFYAIVRRPEPLYGEAKKARIGADPYRTKIDKKEFREQQAQVWQSKKFREFTVWGALKEPDVFYKQAKEAGVDMFPGDPTKGQFISVLSAVGGVARKGSAYTRLQPGPVGDVAYAGESLGRYVEEKPVGASMRFGGAYLLGAAAGAVEGVMAGSTVVGLGAKATKYVWRGGALVVTGLYGKERYGAIKEAETYEARQVEVAKTGIDIFGFGVGARAGYVAVTRKPTVSKPSPPPKTKPVPGTKAKPKPTQPKGAFRPHDYFVRRTISEKGESSFFRVSKETGVAREIPRGDVRQYRDIFGLKGKKAQAKTPDFRPRRPTPERGIKRTGRELMKSESGLDVVRRGKITTPEYWLEKTQPRSVKNREVPKDLVSTPTKVVTETFKDIVKKAPQEIIEKSDYPIKPRDEFPLRERPKSELVEIRELIIRERPPRPKPEKPPKGDGIGPPFIGGFGKADAGGGGLLGIYGRRMKPKGKKGRYVPSQASIEFDIYGEAPKGTLTGLEERPLVGKPKKKKSIFDSMSIKFLSF